MDKLEQLISKFNEADNFRGEAARKASITKAIAKMVEECGIQKTRSEVIRLAAKYNVSYLIKRLTKELFREGDRVFGWWNEELQVMAEPLPLERTSQEFFVTRDDNNKGFYKAENLPISFFTHYDNQPSNVIEVTIEHNSPEWIAFGYAKACKLQWHITPGKNEYIVTRTIFEYGFYCAYKWWEGCATWYENLHPDWFADMEHWGKEVKETRAVLGTENRQFWEDRRID